MNAQSQMKDQLKNSYLNWLKQQLILKDINGAIEVTTPFLDRHNDHLQIYVLPSGNNLKITDDGYIINDLTLSGCDINTPKRREILQTVLNSYGVNQSENDELYVETTLESFPQKKHMLVQAMLTVNDMFMTTKHNIQSIFFEDVEKFLYGHDIRFTDNVSFTGKSGFTQKFDFIIPRSKKSGDRIVQTINNPMKSKTESLLFAWEDIRNFRKNDTQLFVFLNDSEKQISNDLVSAFHKYEVKTVLWSTKDQFVEELSA